MWLEAIIGTTIAIVTTSLVFFIVIGLAVKYEGW